MSDNIVQLSDHISSEKLVPCPACGGNGYVESADPDFKARVVHRSMDDCEMCNSQGEVEESYAQDWPFK